jgi:DHA1 family inner membrane transport protein
MDMISPPAESGYRSADTPAPARVQPPHGLGLAELSLALGGLAIGTAEFAAMGILPDVARDMGVSVPQAGHMISAYALGVVVGAPAITVLLARVPRRGLLIGLMLLFGCGNLLSTLVHSYAAVVAARFIAGLPHGAYFGLAALVAAAMVPSNRRGHAIARVMMGLSVANVVGVPLATWLGQGLGWRATFVAVALIAGITAAMISVFVPRVAAAAGASPLTELGAFRRVQVWLTLLAAAVGFGGVFSVYSYITPILTEVTRMAPAHVPVMLSLMGIGMIVGNVVSGWLTDRWLKGTMVGGYLYTALILAVFVATAQWLGAMVPILFSIGVGTGVTTAFQARLMDVAGDAQSLAAALNHSAFNIANASGAWLGGAAIAAGYGWTSTGAVGLLMALAGTAVLAVSFAVERAGRHRAR